MRHELALAVGLTTAALWLLWADRLGAGWRGELATAGLWWLAAGQTTWRVWFPAVVISAALAVAVPPRAPRRRRLRTAGEAVTERLPHPHDSPGAFPGPAPAGVPRAPFPLTPEGFRERGALGSAAQDKAQASAPLGSPWTGRPGGAGGTGVPGQEVPSTANGTFAVGEATPRPLPVRPVVIAAEPPAVVAARERRVAVKRIGGGFAARRTVIAEQVLAVYRAAGGALVPKQDAAAVLGVDVHSVENALSELKKRGLVENPGPRQWRAVVGSAGNVDAQEASA